MIPCEASNIEWLESEFSDDELLPDEKRYLKVRYVEKVDRDWEYHASRDLMIEEMVGQIYCLCKNI